MRNALFGLLACVGCCGLVGCPANDTPCHQFWAAVADTFDECGEGWGKDWDSTSYGSRKQFLDEQYEAVDDIIEGASSDAEIEDYYDGCQDVWDGAQDSMDSCDFNIYTWYLMG